MRAWAGATAALRLFRKAGLPLYLVFFVTDRCNACCRHCFFGDGTVYPPVEKELALDEIEKIGKSMGRLLFLLPTGGEPFLRNDLGAIVRIFYRTTGVRNVAIPTNGSLPGEIVAAVREILSSCPDIRLGVDVSLDAIGEKHDEIRGFPGLFDRAVRTFRDLTRIAERDARLNVNIETTVSSLNDGLLEESYDYFVKELKPNAIFTLLARGRPRDHRCLRVDMERYGRYAERLERGILSGELSGYRHFPFADIVNAKRIVRGRLISRIAREGRPLLACFAGSMGAALFANGDVYPCELRTDMKLGNVREAGCDFARIWLGEKGRMARRQIRSEGCFCTYECFLTLNILFNVRFWPAVIYHWLRIKASRLRMGRRRRAARSRAGLAR